MARRPRTSCKKLSPYAAQGTRDFVRSLDPAWDFSYLLTTENLKVAKAAKLRFSGRHWPYASDRFQGLVMHLAPSTLARDPSDPRYAKINMCAKATEACKLVCIGETGQLGLKAGHKAMIARTRFFWSERDAFKAALLAEMDRAYGWARRCGKVLAVRLNGTSDWRWEIEFSELLKRYRPSEVVFYDYTALPGRFDRHLPPNYKLTFSRKENNEPDALALLERGVNVAVVFDSRAKREGKWVADPLPAHWRGYRVIDGDVHDLRFLDDLQKQPGEKGLVIGLRFKQVQTGHGREKKAFAIQRGFVVEKSDKWTQWNADGDEAYMEWIAANGCNVDPVVIEDGVEHVQRRSQGKFRLPVLPTLAALGLGALVFRYRGGLG